MRDWLYVEDHVDALLPAGAPHSRLITPVADRPRHRFEDGLTSTVRWYLEHQQWCAVVRAQGSYGGDRLGLLVGS